VFVYDSHPRVRISVVPSNTDEFSSLPARMLYEEVFSNIVILAVSIYFKK